MARLPQFYAPRTRIQPADRGYNAFETAGRRIGSMYSTAAAHELQAAKLEGELAYNAVAFPSLFAANSPSGGFEWGTISNVNTTSGSGGGGASRSGGKGSTSASGNTGGDFGGGGSGDNTTPLQQFTGAVGKTFNIPSTSTNTTNDLGAAVVSGLSQGSDFGQTLGGDVAAGFDSGAGVGSFSGINATADETTVAPETLSIGVGAMGGL